MRRELGSVTEITIVGGVHDGAVGRVLDFTDVGDQRIHRVVLSDGTVIEVAGHVPAGPGMPREVGS